MEYSTKTEPSNLLKAMGVCGALFNGDGHAVVAHWAPPHPFSTPPNTLMEVVQFLRDNNLNPDPILRLDKQSDTATFVIRLREQNDIPSGTYTLGAQMTEFNGSDCVAVHVDYTERETAPAEALEQLERLASIGQLSSGIAHEFNNILTAMTGWTQLARNATQDNQQAQSALEIIEKNTTRARKIASDLLDTANPERTAPPEEISVGEALEESIKLLSWDLSQSGITVRSNIDKTGKCHASYTRLIQVFVNVIKNAIDAIGPSGGTIIADCQISGTDVQMSVKDSGKGVSPDVIARAFDAFFSTKANDDDSYGGNGLGLAMCKNIIEQYNGTIALNNHQDGGTVVDVSLPLTHDSQQNVAPTSQRERLSSVPPGMRVLVVDDEPDICEMIEMALTLKGIEVVSALSGENAIKESKEQLFDAAFLDYAMTGISGHVLGKALSEVQPHLSIIYMSGASIPHELGEKPIFLKKPFNLDDIQTILKNALKKS